MAFSADRPPSTSGTSAPQHHGDGPAGPANDPTPPARDATHRALPAGQSGLGKHGSAGHRTSRCHVRTAAKVPRIDGRPDAGALADGITDLVAQLREHRTGAAAPPVRMPPGLPTKSLASRATCAFIWTSRKCGWAPSGTTSTRIPVRWPSATQTAVGPTRCSWRPKPSPAVTRRPKPASWSWDYLQAGADVGQVDTAPHTDVHTTLQSIVTGTEGILTATCGVCGAG